MDGKHGNGSDNDSENTSVVSEITLSQEKNLLDEKDSLSTDSESVKLTASSVLSAATKLNGPAKNVKQMHGLKLNPSVLQQVMEARQRATDSKIIMPRADKTVTHKQTTTKTKATPPLSSINSVAAVSPLLGVATATTMMKIPDANNHINQTELDAIKVSLKDNDKGDVNLAQGSAPPQVDASNQATNDKTNAKKKKRKRNRKSSAQKAQDIMAASEKMTASIITSNAGTSTPKRGRDNSNGEILALSTEPKTKRLANMPTPTFTKVVQDAALTVAVIDMANDGTIVPLSDGRGDLLLKALNNKAFESLNSGDFLPAFDDTRDIGAALRMKCTDVRTRQWLEKAVTSLKNLWRGANIVVINYNDLPKPHKVNAWFPGCDKPTSQLLRMLEALNEGIDTASWSVIRRKATDKGTTLRLGIDDDSLQAIRNKNFKLYFGVVTAIFYLEEKKNQPAKTEVQLEEDEKMNANVEAKTENVKATDATTNNIATSATNFVNNDNNTVVGIDDKELMKSDEEKMDVETPTQQQQHQT